MNRSENEAQRNMLIDIHNAIVDNPFYRGECILRHEIVEILAAVLSCETESIRDNAGKQRID